MLPVQTALYVPGSSPKMMAKAETLAVDALIFDLEDAVSPAEKRQARQDVARQLTRPSLGQRWVRVNAVGTADQVADMAAILAARPDAIVVPKATPAALAIVAEQIFDGERSSGVSGPGVVGLVETAEGLIRVAEVASAPRLIALQLGAEDLTVDLGVTRTAEGNEILLARQQVALAAHAYRRGAIDTPFLALRDPEGLAHDSWTARQCGMTGKSCIHPSQLPAVKASFEPSEEQVAWAQRVLLAFDGAVADGRGATSLDGRMIDAPVADRARDVLAAAGVEPTQHS